MLIAKKKKDFKIREDIISHFERLAPSGKQTAIVEGLIADWIRREEGRAKASEVRKAYLREGERSKVARRSKMGRR